MTPLIGDWPTTGSGCSPISLKQVRVGGFLGALIDRNREQTIPAAFASPLPRGFRRMLRKEPFAPEDIRYGPDSDLFKWLEGAAYAVAYEPSDSAVREQMESVADMLLLAQEPDGPIATYIKPECRWDTGMWHDLYCAGHFFEAAVAHYHATEDRRLLEAACRWADFLLCGYDQGLEYFEGVGDNEHPEIELALVRLYRASRNERYLDFAGKIALMSTVTPAVADLNCGAGRRHAVRVGYLLTALVEIAMAADDPRYMRYVPELWDEIACTRSYVTGGVAFRPGEIIAQQPYDLPQSGRVAETCASIAMMFLGWRLHGLRPDARHFDRIETILYNHFAGALSLDQLSIFYYNPIRVVDEPALISDHGRSAFQRTRLPNLHSTTCCFPNVVRFLGQLPEYLFSADADGIWVNLYTTSTVEHTLSDDTPVTIEVETTYPHAGDIRITLRSQREAEFTLRVRIPGWCDGAAVTVCGEPVAGVQPGTYLPIRRAWGAADVVEIELPMRPIALEAHPAAAECRGQMAYRRGPLVYCLEQVDVPDVPLQSMRAVADSAIGEAPGAGELDGIPLLRIATAASGEWAEPCAYRPASPRITHGEANLVPFYARANREGPGGWLVWLPT